MKLVSKYRIDLLDMEDSSISKANAGQNSNSPIMFGDVNGLDQDHDPLSPNGSSGNIGGGSRGRSRVWDRFVIAVGGKKVICRLCGDSLAYSNSHSTSSMLKHLKRRHDIDLYPAQEDETPKTVDDIETPQKRKVKKVRKVKRVENSSSSQSKQCMQHDRLVFNESCVRMRWTDHSDAFTGAFSRLYADESYTDVTLVAEKVFFKTHRVILSSASEFFDEMFKMTPAGQHPIIFLKDVKAMDLRILLDFVYNGEVCIPPTLVNDLVRMGKEMKVRGLCDFRFNDSVKTNGTITKNRDSAKLAAPKSAPNASRVATQAHSPSMRTSPSTEASFSTAINSPPPVSNSGAISNSTKNKSPINKQSEFPTFTIHPKVVSGPTISRFPSQPGGHLMQQDTSTCVSGSIPVPSSSNPIPGLKRIRILTTSASGVGNFVPQRLSLSSTAHSSSYIHPAQETVLMVTNDCNSVLTSSQNDISDLTSSTNLMENSVKMDIASNQSHPITLVSHSLGNGSEDLGVVYSLSHVNNEQCEVLMSNSGEDVPEPETIVMYSSDEAIHEPSDTDK